jgi:hypothetical protein
MKTSRLLVAVLLAAACGDIDQVPAAACPENGGLDCPCLDNSTCNRLVDGTQLVCDGTACRRPVCAPEDLLPNGCLCGGTAECQDGLLCVNGNCVPDTGQTLVPPPVPVCYTPCQGAGYTDANGVYQACSPELLVPGCIDGAVCQNGTCVKPDTGAAPAGCVLATDCRAGELCVDGTCQESCATDASCAQGEMCERGLCVVDEEAPVPGVCVVDTDCTEYQTCIANRCYSDCETNDDCREGRDCWLKVCRVPCVESADEDTCPAGTYCHTSDGFSGHCLPFEIETVDPDAPAAPVDTARLGQFDVSTEAFDFGPRDTGASFIITNDSPIERRFTVIKISHTEFEAEGPEIVETYPLHWLTMGPRPDGLAQLQALEVRVPPNGGTAEVFLGSPVNSTLARWSGVLAVREASLGERRITLTYTGSAEGQWTGRVFYLANFGDLGLEEWRKDRTNRAKLAVVGNAFVRRWGAFRSHLLSWDEFKAVITATVTGSWQWASVQNRCPSEDAPNPNLACYLYSNFSGISIYSDFLPDNPVPTGVTDFPITMNVHAADPDRPGRWTGKIVSGESLQYMGSPAVNLVFGSDPNTCANAGSGPCLTFIDEFSANVLVGGRYTTTKFDTDCDQVPSQTFELTSVPWLVPGFIGDTNADAIGRRYRYECRDTLLPFGDDPSRKATNESLAAANPVPDGATRQRKLELIDGALIDQETLLIIFKEQFPSFLDPADEEGFTAYGFMELRRAPEALTPEAYEGSAPEDFRLGAGLEPPSCTADVLDTVGPLDASTASKVAIGLVRGVLPSPGALLLDETSPERVHYWCEDTNLFDGGPLDNGDFGATSIPCPLGSRVIYFTLRGDMSPQDAIAAHDCQVADCEGEGEECGCHGTLTEWITREEHEIRLNPVWRCSDPDEVFCDTDRYDLRNGKQFYAAETLEAVYPSLDSAVTEAFRYKTKFQNRTGQSVGFAPQVCLRNSNLIPYCYDPEGIEEIRERVDCATHIYTTYYDDLGTVDGINARSVLLEYLLRNYAYGEEFVFGLATPLIHDGFERLYSELLIMLGDEAYTAAFASRFDLAGQNLATFEGEKFEPGGINLSGGAGYEMYRLYQAAQYYQLALDRFYRLSPLLWRSIGELPDGQGFVTQATVASWFDRLIRASSQKSRAWSEVAKRYQSFNRPELARLVVERAYTSTHIESIILSRMMLRTVELPNSADAAQIIHSVEQAQLTYTAAMMDMRNVYSDITDELTYFGLPPDYIPFPALTPRDTNAFEKLMQRARQRLETAKEKEIRALEDDRAFESSAAAFQAELAGINRDYETRLSEVCGTFQVTSVDGDVAVYPAIPKYAYLDERARLLGDPCGLMGTGALNDALGTLEVARLDFEGIKLSEENLLHDIDDANSLAQRQCARLGDLRQFRLEKDDEIIRLQDSIAGVRAAIGAADRLMGHMRTLLQFQKCTIGPGGSDCPTGAVASIGYGAISTAIDIGIVISEAVLVKLQHDIAKANQAVVLRDIDEQCTALTINTEFEVKKYYRKLLELQLEAFKLQYRIKLDLSNIQKLRNQALQLMAQQAEAEELAINVEAARNDPNVRIYRNDAVLAADRTFYDALVEAYKATKIYEYYTSQSYGPIIQLHLIRMVSHGDFTLEEYLNELEQEFFTFEEQYGLPDTRVAILSLRDDIFAIPKLDDTATGEVTGSRSALFQQRLQDVALLDDNGYITIPFATSLETLSPLTRNHKIAFIEAELVGSDVGDQLGRVYLRQRGTGVVQSVDGDKKYFAFPERTAVLDTFFNGKPFFDRDIYRNDRLRDRPYVNTAWELVLNKKDEHVNDDINLNKLTDLRLHIYYTDFTGL